MNKKLFVLPSLLILILIPLLLSAQDSETALSADQIIVQPNNILEANGNVIVKRGNIYISADSMKINEKTNQIDFYNIKELLDGKSVKISAERAILSRDLSDGIISAAQVLIDNTVRIRAEEIELKNNAITNVKKIDRITTCEECNHTQPLWNFTASSARNDLKNQNIIYRNVTLRVRGFPVGHVPYLRLPNLGVRRARGFLIPELNISSNLGLGIKVPYFIPIGDSRDLLLTPFISPKTKTIEYRYRQKFSNGDIKLLGAFSDDEIKKGYFRDYYTAIGSLNLRYGIKLNLKATHVSDDAYFQDYPFDLENEENTNISIGKVLVDKDRFFNGDLSYVRDNTHQSLRKEFYLLNGDYTRRVGLALFPGSIIYDANVNSALNIGEENRVTRPPSSASFGFKYTNFRNFGAIQISDKIFARGITFVNSEDVESLKEEFVTKYGISSKVSYPLKKINKGIISFISPNIVLSYNDQKGRTNGDFFSGPDELNFGNLYSNNKMTSLSESQVGISASTGVDYNIYLAKRHKFEFSFGGSWLEDVSTKENEDISLIPKKLNYVGKFRYQNKNSFSIFGQGLINNHGQVLNGNLSSSFRLNDIFLKGSYDFVEARTDERLSNNLENFEISTSYYGFKNVELDATNRFSVSNSAMESVASSFAVNITSRFWDYKLSQTFDRRERGKTSIAAIYNDDCTKISISLHNKFQTAVQSDDIQSVSFMVHLKPFASFSTPK